MRYNSLIKVDADGSNRYYKLSQLNDAVFEVEYGRTGATPMKRKYPMALYDSVLSKKLSEGFSDISKYYEVSYEKSAKYKLIDNQDIRNLVDFLLSCTRKAVEENYNIRSESVSPLMITDAQDIIYKMSQTSDVDVINEYLSSLFVVIPRKMKDVAACFAKEEADIPIILGREQDLLDVMATQVRQKTRPESEKKTILEDYGLNISLVDDPREIESIKKHLSAESKGLFRRAFRVRNVRTDDAFFSYMDAHHLGRADIHYLYHGSKNMNYWGLITEGMKLNPKAPITGKMFGYGLYFANRAKKSINYTSLDGSYWAKGNSKRAYLAVYKVCYGNQLDVHEWKNTYTTYTKSSLHGKDALFAHAGRDLLNDEIIVYDERQCTIQYLIEIGGE